MKFGFIILAALLLTACRIDMTVNGNGTVQTVTNSFDCAASNSGDCTQSYVTNVADCPFYDAINAPNTIPPNCTVIVEDYATCIAMTNETPANCVYDTGVLELFHALAGEGSVFSTWAGDDIGCVGQSSPACGLWISADNASGDGQVAITANFEQEIEPQDASYTYNHLGQRKSKTVAGITTYFVYSDIDGQLLGEYNSSNQPIRQYVYAEGERVAMFVYDNSETEPVKTTIFLANNHIGQVVQAWDATGNPVYERTQTPFGETMGEYATAGINVPVRFPGQYFDAESGFNDNWHRTYDSSTGRYLQSDPIGLAGGINTYGYVGQNPLIRIDLKGLRWYTGGGTVTNNSGAPVVVTGDTANGSGSVTIPAGGSHDFNGDWIDGFAGGFDNRLVDPDSISYPGGAMYKIPNAWPWHQENVPPDPTNTPGSDGCIWKYSISSGWYIDCPQQCPVDNRL